MPSVSIDEFIRQKKSGQYQSSLDPVEDYIQAGEYAVQINKSVQTVNKMCKEGKIKGAIKSGKFWYIPAKKTDRNYEYLIAENARLKEKLRTVLSVIQEN